MTLLYSAQFPLAPPSMNNCFPSVAGKRRVPSRRYAKWQFDVAIFFPYLAKPIDEECRVAISIGAKLSKADIDNLAKPVLDMLVKCSVLATDSKRVVRSLFIEYEPNDVCSVNIWRCDVWLMKK